MTFWRKKTTWIIAAVLLVVVAGVLLFGFRNPVRYTMYTATSVSYDKGTVSEVVSENLQKMASDPSRLNGAQTIVVRMKSGEFKGQELTVTNQLSPSHNIFAKKGLNVIIKVDHPKNTEPYFSVYNYDRTNGILLIILIFAGFMILIGRTKGLRSVIGLAFTLFFFINFMLRMIYHGYSPVLSCVLTILITAVVSMLLLNGPGLKTIAAVCATVLGVLGSAVCYRIFSSVLSLSGYNLPEGEELLIISQHTGLKIGDLLFVGILIASFGAVMDMTISIASSMYELIQIHPKMTAKELVRSGMEIGRDMIGTMCQTLILAFAGSGMTTLLVIISYGTQLNQLLCSDYIAIELIHSITGSIAVIVSVPLTAFLAAFFYTKTGVRRKADRNLPQERK